MHREAACREQRERKEALPEREKRPPRLCRARRVSLSDRKKPPSETFALARDRVRVFVSHHEAWHRGQCEPSVPRSSSP